MKTRKYTKNKYVNTIHRFLHLLLFFILILGLGLMGCEGPQGPQGERGGQGPEGPVGPAGEDGSVMHADEGAPNEDIGAIGDYYLDQNTGELYGPKADDGWGEPGIVLKGEDGQNGADGQDGEDGSQIHSGSGAPDGSLGVIGDFYLDEDNYDLYGPKTSSGWGSSLNLKGADGNANVTRYIFPGHDFSVRLAILTIELANEAEMVESSWNIYLKDSANRIYHIPGFGGLGDTEYWVYHGWDSAEARFRIIVADGPGEGYEQIEIVCIEASNTEDRTKWADDNIIPDHLDVSNYEEVAEYYGFDGG